jgi:type II secretory pathway component PulC
MATNRIPLGSRNISVNMPVEMVDAVRELAAKSGMPLSTYVRHIIEDAEQRGLIVHEKRERYIVESQAKRKPT